MEKGKRTPQRGNSYGASRSIQEKLPSAAQVTAIQYAVEVFIEELRKERKVSGPVDAIKSLKALREQIRIFREEGLQIPPEPIFSLITGLENGNDTLCQRLTPPVFSVILRVLLQAEPCRDAERGYFLLANSLVSGSDTKASQDALATRKGQIGAQVLVPLLQYFLDGKNFHGMRRWAGILCGQLVKDCPKNYEKVEVCPDELRTKIGLRMIEEDDELARIICGQFVKDLNAVGSLLLATLFPEGYDNAIYDDFPPMTQGENGWMVQFDEYITNALPLAENVMKEDDLYHGWAVNLQPNMQFGDAGKNAQIFVREDDLTFMTIAPGSTLDQLLDVPLDIIRTFLAKSAAGLRKDILDVMIELEDDVQETEDFCYLDGQSISLTKLWFTGRRSQVLALASRLERDCPSLRVSLDDESDEENDDVLNASQAQLEIPINTRGQDLDEDGNFYENEEQNEDDLQDAAVPSQASFAYDRGDEEDLEENSEDIGNGEDDGDDEATLPVPRDRDETPENTQINLASAGGHTEDTERLVRLAAAASDQDTSDRLEEESPSQNRGRKSSNSQSSVSPITKRVTKPASRPDKRHIMKPIPIFPDLKKAVEPKVKPPTGGLDGLQAPPVRTQGTALASGKPKSIKPKAKLPIGGLMSSQAPVAMQVDDLVEVKPLSDLLKKPFRDIKAGATAVSKSTTKSKPTIKLTKKAPSKSLTRKKFVALDQDEDDDEITSPENSPPSKKRLPKSQPEPKPATKDKKTEGPKDAVPRNKRYSLHPRQPVDPQPVAKNKKPVFDLPSDEEEEVETKKKSSKPKLKGKVQSRKSAGDAAVSKPTKSNTKKKRQSAPANFQPSAGTRQSQRGAAANAIARMKGADASDEEAEDDQETQMPNETVVKKAIVKKAVDQAKEASKTVKGQEDEMNDDDAEETQLLEPSAKNAEKNVVVDSVEVPPIDPHQSDDEAEEETQLPPPQSDNEAEEETQLPPPSSTRNTRQNKVVGKAAKSQVLETADRKTKSRAGALFSTVAASKAVGPSKKVGSSQKAQPDDDSELEVEEETQLPQKPAASTTRTLKALATRTAVHAIDTSRSIAEDDGDDFVAKASQKTAIIGNNAKPVNKQIIAAVEVANESENEDETNLVQPDLPKPNLGSRGKKVQQAAAKSMEVDDGTDDEATQISPPQKPTKLANTSKSATKKKQPTKTFKSNERVESSDEPENADEQSLNNLKPAAKSAPRAAVLEEDVEARSKNITTNKDSTPTVTSSNIRAQRNKLVANSPAPKTVTSTAEPIAQAEIDAGEDASLPQDYTQLMENFLAPRDEDEEVLAVPSPELTKLKLETKNKASQAVPSQKPKRDWADSLGQLLDSGSDDEPQPHHNGSGASKNTSSAAQYANLIIPKEPTHDLHLAPDSGSELAEGSAQILNAEGLSMDTSSLVATKKRKVTEDDQDSASKRRSMQTEVKPISKPNLISQPHKVKKTAEVQVEPLISTTTDGDFEGQSRSTRNRPSTSDKDISVKQPKLSNPANRTPTRGSMGPPPLSATQLKNMPGSISKSELVDDHLQRKPHVISFGAGGPRNQGLSSAQKNSAVQSGVSMPKVATPVVNSAYLKRNRNMLPSATEHNMEEPQKNSAVQPTLPEPSVTTPFNSADLKRKRDMLASGAEHNMEEPQKKKHSPEVDETAEDDEMVADMQIPSSSPPVAYAESEHEREEDRHVVENEQENVEPIIRSSPPQVATAIAVLKVANSSRPPLRQSSGSSRVNQNGSPQPSPSVEIVDHMGQLKLRLSQEIHASMSNFDKSSENENVDQRDTMPKQKSKISSLAKAVPSSPTNSGQPRYEAHNEIQDGQYQSAMGGMIEQSEMADPFSAAKPTRTKSSFMERLQSRDGKKGSRLQFQQDVHIDDEDLIVRTMHDRPLSYRGLDSKRPDPYNGINTKGQVKTANTRPPPARDSYNGMQAQARSDARSVGGRDHRTLFGRDSNRRVSTEDEDRTLVNRSRERYNPSVPSSPSVSSGSSHNSSDGSRTPQDEPDVNDRWNSAVRPHQRGIYDSIHAVADEVMIQLSSAEDTMGLLVQDYKNKGGKVLSKFETTHKTETSEVRQKLKSKNDEIVKEYKIANEAVDGLANDTAAVSVAGFEVEWKKREARIQETIAKGLSK